jgi:hypothetical protein
VREPDLRAGRAVFAAISSTTAGQCLFRASLQKGSLHATVCLSSFLQPRYLRYRLLRRIAEDWFTQKRTAMLDFVGHALFDANGPSVGMSGGAGRSPRYRVAHAHYTLLPNRLLIVRMASWTTQAQSRGHDCGLGGKRRHVRPASTCQSPDAVRQFVQIEWLSKERRYTERLVSPR